MAIAKGYIPFVTNDLAIGLGKAPAQAPARNTRPPFSPGAGSGPVENFFYFINGD